MRINQMLFLTFVLSIPVNAFGADYILRIPVEAKSLHQDVTSIEVRCYLHDIENNEPTGSNTFVGEGKVKKSTQETGKHTRSFSGIVTVSIDLNDQRRVPNKAICSLYVCKAKTCVRGKHPASPGYDEAPLWSRYKDNSGAFIVGIDL